MQSIIQLMGPLRLIIISIIVFGFFVAVSFFLKKHKKFPIFLLLMSSTLPLVSLLRPGVHQSGDFALHIERAIDLWISLENGIFPVRWAAFLNSTYGYPLFIFIYPLPYYSLALLKMIGVSFIFAEKFLIAITFILSGIGTYQLARTFLKPIPAVFSGILYLFAPYHLVDMHFRVAIGELFAYALLPFVFLYIIKLSKRSSFLNFFACLFCYAALILSHPAISIVTTPAIFALSLILRTRRRRYVFLSLFFAILLTSFYWLPAILETNSTLQTMYGKSVSFENPLLYFVSPWRYGFLYQGPAGQISFPMGFIQLLMLLIALYYILKKVFSQQHRIIIISLISLFFALFLLLLPISLPVWKVLPLMTNFQFAYRLMLPISFLLALIGGITSEYMNKKIIMPLIYVTIITTILNWGTRGMIGDITDTYLIEHLPLATAEGEGLQAADPKWRDPVDLWYEVPPTSHLEIVRGDALVKQMTRSPILHEYNVKPLTFSTFVENTLYFPGWNLYVNGKKSTVKIDEGKTGLMYFSLKPGNYHVAFRFEDTLPRIIGNTLSALTFLFIIITSGIYLIFHKRK